MILICFGFRAKNTFGGYVRIVDKDSQEANYSNENNFLE